MEMGLDQPILARISGDAGVQPHQAQATIALLDQQSTIPFIARYRKEVTGNLDEVQIRTISERHEYYKELLSRRETILNSISEQGKLTDELKAQLLACYDRNELEDLYLPYKPKRKTKAGAAIEKGLEPLAKFIWDQVPGETSVDDLAESFINSERGVPSRAEALEGALHIVAEWISEDLEIRKALRRMTLDEAVVVSKLTKAYEGQKTKYDMYRDFREAISKIPSHRMLAIRRGFKEQILAFSIESDAEKALRLISQHVIKDANSAFAPFLQTALRDSYDRLLSQGIQTEVRALLRDRSDSEAIKVFESNLASLLLAPPAGPMVVLGIDPGLRTGCKVAVVNETGKFLEHATIYPTEPRKDIAGAESTLYRLTQKHQVQAIAIGNGTGSRETDLFVRGFLGKYKSGESFRLLGKNGSGSEKMPPVSHALPSENAHQVSAEGFLPSTLEASAESAVSERKEGVEQIGQSAESPVRSELTAPSGDRTNELLVEQGPFGDISVSLETNFSPEKSLVAMEPGDAFEKESRSLAASHSELQDGSGDAAASSPIAEADHQLTSERHAIFSTIVNESGASVYSASEGARREFPRLDLTVRGAVSIARRLQDPLAELVKIHPKSIGVGQYQHDVEQKRLKRGLEGTVESCVNRVGVDLNTASFELLRYVSGINQKLAKTIVEHRDVHGRFRSRSQLASLDGFGTKTYEQAAGFLRIKGGENPLDATAVHPESYEIVSRMAASLGLATAELIENSRMIEKLDLSQFSDEKGLFTLNDIKQELLKPGRDPRDQFAVPAFREDVNEVSDLKEGMVLEGTVSNVTNFGAFVDIGVHQDGLVHVSELSNRFVKDPREAVHVGEIVKVKVIAVDVAMKRISLSMKALLPQPPKVAKAKSTPPQRTAGKKIAHLAEAGVNPKPAPAFKPQPSKDGKPIKKAQPQKARPLPKVEVGLKQSEGQLPSPRKPESPLEPVLSFADKIRMLQEKFGGIR
jgi:transcriptional accessory protein Tex/SPT6